MKAVRGVKKMLGEKLLQLRKKQGYSQQEVADMLSVTRQTISNWECDQAIPTIDKANTLAKLYNISLDVLLENDIDIMSNDQKNDFHVLKHLVGKLCRLECYNSDLLLDTSGKVKIIDINNDWIKIEYERTKNNALLKKEKVIRLIDLADVKGFEILEES